MLISEAFQGNGYEAYCAIVFNQCLNSIASSDAQILFEGDSSKIFAIEIINSLYLSKEHRIKCAESVVLVWKLRTKKKPKIKHS
jgi:hypothetical protein